MAGLRIGVTTFLTGLCVLLAACGGGDKPKSLEELAVKDYDPQFPPDLPFNPDEWLTNDTYESPGDPDAKRVPGSTFVMTWAAFPPTLRTDGPNSNLIQTRLPKDLHFERLLQIDSETEEFMPFLATHWKIEQNDDGTQTFTFRLNPKAKWSDGHPVTADDVLASWWHKIQEDRKDPMNRMIYHEDYDEPEILDRYTIRVKTKERNWRLFLYFGVSMEIFPARYVRIPGEKFLKDYNWRYMPGSGPYYLKAGDLKKGESMTLTRRKDYWAENERWFKNTFNFEKIKFLTVRDREMVYEMFKKGDLDWFRVTRAQRWVEDIPKENIIQKGWVQRRKIYNQAPQGYAGFCFNMRKPPFNDKRMRLAFAHLFNRERLMEKLFFNEYEYINSIFPGRDWGSEADRDRVHFDPARAAALFGECGYEERNDDGYLVGPDGNILEVTLEFGNQQWERIWLVVKEDYEKAGVKFNLKLVDPSTLTQKVSERQFTIHFQSWGAILFPNPETTWRSDLADQKFNNNIPGFKNERVDELCEQYNVTFDRAAQKKITREIDTLVCAEHPYAMGWYGNFLRILYWDKFGHPAKYFTRTGDQPEEMMFALWWPDPEKAQRLKQARDNDKTLPQGPKIVKPWASGGDK